MRTVIYVFLLATLPLSAVHAQCPEAIGSDVDRDGVDDFCDASYLPPFAPPSPNPGYGAKRILVAHFKFPGEAPLHDAEDTRARLMGAHPFSITQFYAEISYGAAPQTYDIRDWVDLPQDRMFYETNDQTGDRLVRDALSYVASHYDLQGIDAVVLNVVPLNGYFPGIYAYLPPGVPIGNSGLELPVAVLTGTAFEAYSGNASHEIGHTYGFKHSSEVRCKTWRYGIPATLTDPFYNEEPCAISGSDRDGVVYGYAGYDMMGNLRGHPNSAQKWQAGWLRPAQLKEAPTSATFALDAYEPATEGAKAIRIPYGADEYGLPVDYWIEYRTKPPVDLDTHAPRTDFPSDRMLIWARFRVLSAWQSSTFQFLTPGTTAPLQPDGMQLPPGGTFFDPYRGFRITRRAGSSVEVERSDLRFEPAVGVRIGPEEVREVRVVNAGDRTVTFGAAQLKGRTPSTFRIETDGCNGQALPKGVECRVTVRSQKTPGRLDIARAHLEFTTDDPLWPTPTIGLIGEPLPTPDTLPRAPSIGNPVAGITTVSVPFIPQPSGTGTLVSYTAVCTGGIANTGTSSPITVTGLTSGVPTRCVVKTTTSAGDSAWSVPSAPVTPLYGPRRRSTRS
ncbi:MAG TPA: hypothetical protein VKB93_06730 [Thermoanaerobaculia bacterium]|nr:hypothetical protein [Thermoanaerobaculia bacterium]